MKDWNNAYKELGRIQTKVAGIVEDAAEIFPEGKVFDLCFGTGRHALFLAEKGFDVYGIDISEKAKEITEKLAHIRGVKLHLETADMHKLPYEDESFEAIVAVHALAHNDQKSLRVAIAELDRIAKPGCIIAVTLLSKNDSRYGKGKKVDVDTYFPLDDPHESEVPHIFQTEDETRALFPNYEFLQMDENKFISHRRNGQSAHWEFIIKKS